MSNYTWGPPSDSDSANDTYMSTPKQSFVGGGGGGGGNDNEPNPNKNGNNGGGSGNDGPNDSPIDTYGFNHWCIGGKEFHSCPQCKGSIRGMQ